MSTKNIENRRSRDMTTGVVTRSKAKRMLSENPRLESTGEPESKPTQRSKSIAPPVKKSRRGSTKTAQDTPKLFLKLEKVQVAPQEVKLEEKQEILIKGILKKTPSMEPEEKSNDPVNSNVKAPLVMEKKEMTEDAPLYLICIGALFTLFLSIIFESVSTAHTRKVIAESEVQSDFAEMLKNLKSTSNNSHAFIIIFQFSALLAIMLALIGLLSHRKRIRQLVHTTLGLKH